MRNEWEYNAWKTLSGGAMKKYLFGLGAMLVGAGLMFVLMYGEVSAEGEPGIMHCKTYKSDSVGYAPQAY